MNFKSWLLITEAKKDINLSNPNLTTTIPPLNTSVSNPKLTNTKISRGRSYKDRELASNEKVKELAIRYKQLGTGEYPPKFKQFLNTKRLAYKDYITNTKSLDAIWYPSDIIVARENGLPEGWMDSQMEIYKSKNELISNKQVKELAIRYKQFGTGEYPPEFKDFLQKKRSAYEDFLKGIKSNYKWYPSDIIVAKENGLPDNWMERQNELMSNKQVKELAIRYKQFGTGEYPPEYSHFLQKKRSAYRDFLKGIKSNYKWYPSDIIVAKENGLPDNWMDSQIEIIKSKNEQKSNDRFKDIAIYYGRNGSGPSSSDSNEKIAYLGGWHSKKKNEKINPYEESDNKTWADMVELSKSSNWIDPVTEEPFKHSPLPDNWRDIEPRGIKSGGEELVSNILKELEIKNDTEHRDAACKNKRCLPFDFSITHNGKKYLLEYHGKQHYHPSYFGSKKDKTDQVIANNALKQFEYTQGNDTIKYDHCVKENLPFLVIPYWLYKKPDIIKNRIIEFLNTNEFNETFANPVVPQNYKAYHDKILKITECFASGKLDCKELFKKQKTTFEQFLINKNFINI
jgi:hypothetical protein